MTRVFLVAGNPSLSNQFLGGYELVVNVWKLLHSYCIKDTPANCDLCENGR